MKPQGQNIQPTSPKFLFKLEKATILGLLDLFVGRGVIRCCDIMRLLDLRLIRVIELQSKKNPFVKGPNRKGSPDCGRSWHFGSKTYIFDIGRLLQTSIPFSHLLRKAGNTLNVYLDFCPWGIHIHTIKSSFCTKKRSKMNRGLWMFLSY